MWRRWKEYRAKVRWVNARENALWRASNGEHLPRLEREYLQLPEWTK